MNSVIFAIPQADIGLVVLASLGLTPPFQCIHRNTYVP